MTYQDFWLQNAALAKGCKYNKSTATQLMSHELIKTYSINLPVEFLSNLARRKASKSFQFIFGYNILFKKLGIRTLILPNQ